MMATQNVGDLVAGGSTLSEGAIAETEKTVRGEYLDVDSNPYLRGVGEAAASDITRSYQTAVQPGIASRFGGAGRSAGPQDVRNAEGTAMSMANRDLGQELAQMYAGLYGGAYESERGRMGTAAGMAPAMRGMQFADQAALQAAGRDEFKYAQLQLSDLVNRFNFEQNEPYERMGRFQSLISQPGGYGTSAGTMGAAQGIGMGAAFAGPMIGEIAQGLMS